jgi:EAL domain-containing protein (putative c-di-GMP-specific phosphodiesterase class I)
MGAEEARDADQLIQSALRLLHHHLDVEVVAVSHLLDETAVYRYVHAAPGSVAIQPGTVERASTSYAHSLVDHRLPPFLRNAAQDPVATTLPATHALPIATHLAAPLTLSDGSPYGALSCFSRRVHHDLDAGVLGDVRSLATMLGPHLEAVETARRRHERRRAQLRVLTLTDDLELHLVFQPIVSLDDGEVVGMEALARFPRLHNDTPEVFADARRLQVGHDLELRAVAAALDELPRLPDDIYLAVNVGPTTAASDEFVELLRSTDTHRIVVEITEHEAVEDYRALTAALDTLGGLGVRLAIDDVGTGFSGLDQILRLAPEILKIDGALVHDVDTCPDKQAMIAALLNFAGRVGTTVVAEHVERSEELATLRALGVAYGQGYLFGRPSSLAGPPPVGR